VTAVTSVPQEEQTPQEGARHFRELFENAADMVYTTDLPGNFTSINKTGEQITGYTREELIASNISRIVTPETHAVARELAEQMLNNGSHTTCELEIVAKDGRRVPVEVCMRLMYRGGRPVGVHGIARDISPRKQADRKIRQHAAHLEALSAIIAAADASPDLQELLPIAIDRVLEVLGLGIGGIWVGDQHIVRGLSPDIGRAIVDSAQRPGYKMPATLSVDDWNEVPPDGSSLPADAWIHIGVRAALIVPITVDSRHIGVLAVASAYPRTWTWEEIALVESVGQQVAATVEGLRLFRETRHRTELMERLVALSDSLNRPLSMQKAVPAIGRAALSLSEADRVAVFVRLPDGTVTCPWSRGLSDDYVAQVLAHQEDLPVGRLLKQDGIALDRLELPGGRVVVGTKPFLFSDVQDLPVDALIRRLGDAAGHRALGIWPLTYEGRVIALVACYYNAPRTWSRAELEVFQALCGQAAAALENALLYETQARRRIELEALYGLSSQLRAAYAPDKVFSILGEHAARLLHADYVALCLLDPDRHVFTRVQTVGVPLEAQRAILPIVSGGILDRATQQEAPYTTDDASREFPSNQLDALREVYHDLGPVAAVALRSEREVIGTIVLGRARNAISCRPFTHDEIRLLQGIAEMGGTAISRARLYHNLEQAYIQMVLALAQAVDARDARTRSHSEHMATLTDSLAEAMGLPKEEANDIRWAALLHDIGKIGMPDSILSKPGPLTEPEWTLIREHPIVGERILLPVERMRAVAKIVRHHQEKWDGSGYPDGLQGDAIPLGARVLAIIDAYSAITEKRPYKGACSRAEAMAELKRCAGTQFDPRVTEIFCELLDRNSEQSGEMPRLAKPREGFSPPPASPPHDVTH